MGRPDTRLGNKDEPTVTSQDRRIGLTFTNRPFLIPRQIVLHCSTVEDRGCVFYLNVLPLLFFFFSRFGVPRELSLFLVTQNKHLQIFDVQ